MSNRYPPRECPSCHRMVRIEASGVYAKHFRRSLSGRRELCLASKRNALTATELGWPKARRA